MSGVNWTALIILVVLFGAVTIMGFMATRWRRPTSMESLDEWGLGGVGVVADLFHLRNEAEPLEVVRRHGDRIGHVHLSDPERRPPGTVDDVWRTFLDAVHDGGYRGAVSLECRWSPDPDAAEAEMHDALGRVRAAQPTAT